MSSIERSEAQKLVVKSKPNLSGTSAILSCVEVCALTRTCALRDLGSRSRGPVSHSDASTAVAPTASIVVISPFTAEIGSTQERAGLPSRYTVHAPHWPIPQPNFCAGKTEMIAQDP